MRILVSAMLHANAAPDAPAPMIRHRLHQPCLAPGPLPARATKSGQGKAYLTAFNPQMLVQVGRLRYDSPP